MREKEILFSAKITVESNIMSKKDKKMSFDEISNNTNGYYAFAKQKMNKLAGISTQNI